MFRTTNFQLVEVKIGQSAALTGTGNQIPFEQQPQLQSVADKPIYIKAVEAFSSSALTISPITQSLPVASPFDITNATLTLVEKQRENKQNIPLAVLNRCFATGPAFVPFPPQLFLLKNVWEIDFVSCFITVLTAPPVQPFSYLFGFHYSYEPDLY